MLCPKCGIAVDQSGTEWVQLFIDAPFRWSPVCHRDCSLLILKDLPMMRVRMADVEVKTQLTPRVRKNTTVGKKRVKR